MILYVVCKEREQAEGGGLSRQDVKSGLGYIHFVSRVCFVEGGGTRTHASKETFC
jgi:hypothetical protein